MTKITLNITHFIEEKKINWKNYFCNNNNLELEIGIGKGHYIFERALKNPKINIIGIEYKKRLVEEINCRIEKKNINNICIIHGNAWSLVPLIFKNESLTNITLNFPDPWWKRRHHKRRIINEKFANILILKLAINGTILLQSDVKEIFDKYLYLLNINKAICSIKKKDESFFLKNIINTKSYREKKCIKLNLSIYRILLMKNNLII